MCSIAAFGNPLLDIIVHIENNELLKKYEIDEDDQKEITDFEMKNLYQDISRCSKQVTAGGCAQNTLRVMQWLLNKPNSTVFFGTIANDEQGTLLNKIVSKDKVITRYTIDEDHITGMCIALASSEHRALLANVSAAQYYRREDLENDIEGLKILKSARIVYLEACFLPNRVQAAQFIEKFCTKHNKVLVFNLSAAYLFDLEPNLIENFAKNCHILFGNKKEFYALGKLMKIYKVGDLAIKLNKSFKDYDRTNSLLRYGKIIVITNGSKSIKCVHSNGVFTVAKVKDISTLPVVDTISAGDAFVAGFLTGLLQERDIEQCLGLAQLAAVQIILQPGCTIPDYPAKNVLDKFELNGDV